LIKRANEVLAQLEAGEAAKQPTKAIVNKSAASGFDNLFTNPLIEKLANIDVMSLTPVEALNILYKLQQEAKTGVGNS
jgi:DNA mismatch repair protein MutS